VIVDAVNPVEAAWRGLAAGYCADLKIIECICADQATHRCRIEARVRNIEGMAEITSARVEQRRAEYEAWDRSKADAGYLEATARAIARRNHRSPGLSRPQDHGAGGSVCMFVRQSVARVP
jgi:hypothetical protein